MAMWVGAQREDPSDMLNPFCWVNADHGKLECGKCPAQVW